MIEVLLKGVGVGVAVAAPVGPIGLLCIKRTLADGKASGMASGLGASVDMPTYRSNGARNIYVANMMLWGPGFFTSSAFMMALVAEQVLKTMFATEIPIASPQLETT
ncbi:hypothetical protein PAF17_15400 [Paracoccus sp. Z330]|uniref:Uncharacterized protein n=1 Tax=Paracoccus onchidii TaxID=3017813 RepID=A0ABT4ZHT9_9RHOB|nr:hypothetical protein [Paracoccus onchidii]MDB6178878.1 hypothetical protein [Paracoccus onchidii]